MSRGAFHSTKTFENLETAANGTEIFRKSFQKLRKLLNFRSANHSTENSRNSESKVKWKEVYREKVSENMGIPREVVLCLEILENAVPLGTGSCRNSDQTFWLNEKRPNCNILFFEKRETLELD